MHLFIILYNVVSDATGFGKHLLDWGLSSVLLLLYDEERLEVLKVLDPVQVDLAVDEPEVGEEVAQQQAAVQAVRVVQDAVGAHGNANLEDKWWGRGVMGRVRADEKYGHFAWLQRIIN